MILFYEFREINGKSQKLIANINAICSYDFISNMKNVFSSWIIEIPKMQVI